MDKISFMDLDAQFTSVDSAIRQSVSEILESKQFIHGAWAKQFAQKFLDLHGGTYGVGCSNGTSAITVALRALKIGGLDHEVLVPNNTFFGTIEPVVEVGAKPVLVEVRKDTYGMDLNDLAQKITSKTKAIIPVHLYGNPEAMDEIIALARQHGLRVIEDCAQSHLARFNGRPVGTFGDVSTFSFYPGKNLGAAGDAGFILTEDHTIFDFVSKYVDHGRTEKYVHEFFGGNYRMDAIQAAVLMAKLPKMLEWTALRKQKASFYDLYLKPNFKVIESLPGADPVYHLYLVEVGNREEVIKHFDSLGIGYGIHYPVPLNAQPALRQFGYKVGDFPVSEGIAKRILSLPLYPELSPDKQELIVQEFLKIARNET